MIDYNQNTGGNVPETTEIDFNNKYIINDMKQINFGQDVLSEYQTIAHY